MESTPIKNKKEITKNMVKIFVGVILTMAGYKVGKDGLAGL